MVLSSLGGLKSLVYAMRCLQRYLEVESVLEKTQLELDLASSRGRHQDAVAELEQLEMMYKGSELEDRTSEIVLKRGRRNRELALQRLELQERKLSDLVESKIPMKARELERSVTKAEYALRKHDRDRRLATLRQELKVIELRYKLDKTSRKINGNKVTSGF